MTRLPWLRAATLAASLALALLAPAARADMFSPGPLARGHAALEGLSNCTKCHVAGKQLSGEACLACHTELKDRVAKGRGFHGTLPPAERDKCERCHHDHQGREFAMVDWGKGGKKAFNHAKTGYELRGKHRPVDCAKCHDRRLVKDPAVLELLAKQPQRASFLGTPTACAACHFDEHRAQVGADCQKCHVEDAWKPAKSFKHAKTAYPLLGKHAKVECAKCHKPEQDPEGPRTAPPGFTAPVNASVFARWKPLHFAKCTDCHKDPHQGRFGENCTSCHTVDDWKKLTGEGAKRAFHEKTKYPLRGAHAEVKCQACHGPYPGVKAKYKGLPFERCTDCHFDAHVGQLAKLSLPRATGRAMALAKPASVTCDACHRVEGWLPAAFEADDHARLPYKLEGAHRTVACALCHPKDPLIAARFPAASRKKLASMKREVKVSEALLLVAKANDCRTCHRDPHAGQFQPKNGKDEGCTRCHGADSFRKVRFDHAKDSRFPLLGKHAPAACGSCHRPDVAGVVRYKPLPLACSACHADVHAGQFLAKGQGNDCARCHAPAGWKDKDLLFKHQPPFTKYVLEGKHRKVECAKCHAPVRIADQDVKRYRPRPTACEACHADFHKGAFKVFAPSFPAGVPAPAPAPLRPAGVRAAKADLGVRPEALAARDAAAAAATGTNCAACHTAEDWKKGAFDHDRTGFPLESAHKAAACSACHGQGTLSRAVPRACSACHQDVHVGRLGQRCERCHEATTWRAVAFDADAHRRSDFPLTGRHAFTPCDSCHGDRRDRGFQRPVRACIGCHEPDWARASSGAASVNHTAAGFPQTCQQCHTAWRFSPAGFPAHDQCFKLSGTKHAGIRCLGCHTTFPTVNLGQPLTCSTDTANCIQCHACGNHPSVAGFACGNRKCYECHAFSNAFGALQTGAGVSR